MINELSASCSFARSPREAGIPRIRFLQPLGSTARVNPEQVISRADAFSGVGAAGVAVGSSTSLQL